MSRLTIFDLFPDLFQEWDYDRNSIDPNTVMPFSNRRYWWKCNTCGYNWEAPPASRSNGSGCPACSGRVAIVGKTDLQSQAPDVAAEWDYQRNSNILPSQVTVHSSKKVWWICSQCGNSWEARIAGRTTNHRGCPICAGRKVVPGINDLSSVNKELATEWDKEKNTFSPNEVTANSGRKAWWVCSVCGYSWQAVIASRNSGIGCPKCAKALQSSFPEQAIFFYLRQCFPEAINSYHPNWLDSRSEIDIFLPSINIGIEYDGFRWHSNVEKDRKKDIAAKENGVSIIRFREKGLPLLPMSDSLHVDVDQDDPSFHSLSSAIQLCAVKIERLAHIKVELNVNVERDYPTIRSLCIRNREKNTLAHIAPDFLCDWDNTRNAPLLPTQITIGSDARVWWNCQKCGYSWQATVGDRNRGSGCPRCAGKVPTHGVTDLQSNSAFLSLEWLQEKNGSITPQTVTTKSNKKVWWRCSKCGYEWQARISDRFRGSGCPACAGRVAVPGKTDLATVNPSLSLEWDYDKNDKSFSPHSITGNSNKKVWWICNKCGWSWQAAVYSRNSGRGCPECAKKRKTSRIRR